LLAGLGIKSAEVAKNLQILLDVVRRELPHEPARVAAEMLERAIAEYPELPDREESKLDPTAPRYELAKAYLQDLLAGRRQVASSRILDAVDEGVPIKDIYLNVFQPTQREVGRLWQVNELTVAQEHYCTAATQMIMCQLYPMLFDQPKNGMTFVGTCVGGELHEIGVRMITDFFELEGWDTYFMGANTPTADLVSTLIAQEAEVLGISATIAYHVRQVEEIVEQVRSKPELSSVRVLVGGYPFNQDRKLWKEVGADGYGADAEDAVQTARRLAL
jgi:methanogenic corrinoid protein MtbC1